MPQLPKAQKVNLANVSEAVRRLNPELYGTVVLPPAPTLHATPHAEPEKKQKTIRQRRRVMKDTEREFSAMLDRQKAAGEILDWNFEGITLRYGRTDIFQYTPDFVVTVSAMEGNHLLLRMVEVKGKKIFDRAVNQFKQARDAHPCFEFEFHQRLKGGEWHRLA